MSLASWILDRFTTRRPNRASARRSDDVILYLRRMEDRRVLTGAPTAIDDAYFVQDAANPLLVSDQLGLLSNDLENGAGSLQVPEGPFTTDLGGTVALDAGGGFTYVAPTGFGPFFVDTFVYTANNGVDFTNAAQVTFYVGDVPVGYEQPTLLPIFGVESETQVDFVQLDLASLAGASLTILDPTGITFDLGFNGASDLSISGTADDINRALDSLEYTPPPFFSGSDTLLFFAEVDTGGPFPEESSQFVPIFVIPPECGCGGGPGEIVAVPDQYYVPPFQSGFYASFEAGLLANDLSAKESFVFAISETVTTDLGGTVEIYSDGSFFYTPPTLSNPNFVDSFVYFASDEISISNPGFVTLFVGQVPVPEDIDVPLTIFNVEFGTSSEMVTVDLSSVQGGSLTLLNTAGVSFLAGSNGGTSFTVTGFFDDVNFALDTLHYRSPLNYSGLDFVNFEVVFPDRAGPAFMQESPGFPSQPVPINVLPIADAPLLSIAPQPVVYQPGVPVPVDINVALLDVDGSEIPGLVILDFVPPGVVPSAGQQLPNDPKAYLLLPSDLEGLTFFVDASAPPNFNIIVIATSIETTNQPGVFGGPGGPLLPNHPLEPRFAISSQLLMFIRQGSEGLPPVGPPPKLPPPPPHEEVVFLLGPLSDGPHNHHGPDPRPQHPHHVVATVVETHHNHGLEHHAGTLAVFADDAIELGSDGATAEERSNEQSRRSFGSPGIYLRRLGSDDPGQIAHLPEELSENYSRFMDFLKTLPNGDYVVYFKRAGQPHAEAEVRQVVVRVRVVNHRLNPDPGEFKPAGEVAEPPQNPNLPMVPATTEAPIDQRAELPQPQKEEAAIAAGTGWAALIAWKLQAQREKSSTRIDQLMERFLRKPSLRSRRPAKRL